MDYQEVSVVSEAEIENVIWQVVTDCAKRGPGWAQEGVVLRTVSEQVPGGRGDLRVQQIILNIWHDLFQKKKLAWGYDLANPNSPFFHVR